MDWGSRQKQVSAVTCDLDARDLGYRAILIENHGRLRGGLTREGARVSRGGDEDVPAGVGVEVKERIAGGGANQANGVVSGGEFVVGDSDWLIEADLHRLEFLGV